MLKNFTLLAWRNLVRHPFYSSISIVGLAIGLLLVFMVSGYVWKEWRVNKSLKDADRQYIIYSQWKDNALGVEFASVGPLAKTLYENYPQLVDGYYRYDGITSNVSAGENVFREGLQVGDSTFLSMYGFSLEAGNAATALNAPYKAVVTAEVAKKYFGTSEALGKTLTIENFSGSRHDFEITAILKPLEVNSVTHLVEGFPNSIIVSDGNLEFFGRNMAWNNYSIPSYVRLKKGVTPEQLKQPMKDILRAHAPEGIADILEPRVVSLHDSYFSMNNGMVSRMLFILSGIAVFIMLMAVVNFINISISRASGRLKEIGVRKTMGSSRGKLVWQFLVESVVLVFFSALLGAILYLLLRPVGESILGKSLPVPAELPYAAWLIILAALLATGIMAGLYQALSLSAISVVRAVKGKWTAARDKVWLRKGLIGFQFSIAVLALAGAVVISQQINLFFSRQLGYNKEMIVTAQVPRDWTAQGVDRMQLVRSQFARMPELASVSLSYEVPNGANAGSVWMYRAGQDSTQATPVPFLATDANYINTYGIPMKAGQFFAPGNEAGDSLNVVINELQAKRMGWKPDEAVGQMVRFYSDNRLFRIKGVTSDFHFGSMHKPIEGYCFMSLKTFNIFRYFSFKLKPGHPAESIAALQAKWRELLPGAAFEYRFMDEMLQNLYTTEMRLKRASYFSTSLSIIIVVLGLVGLIAMSVQRRMKEVGIRKVLGASVTSVIRLFIKEFIPILLISSLVAIPLSWWLMSEWLNSYAYRITLNPIFFLLAAFAVLFIGLAVIGLQTIRLGMKKPAELVHNND